MPERLNLAEEIKSQENFEFLSYFPTNLERAKSGLEKFLELREKNPVFKKAIEGNESILHSMMGLRPEAGYYWGRRLLENLVSEEAKKLRTVFEQELGFKIFSTISRRGNYIFSLLNPASVEKVVKTCPIPGLFPDEAKIDPIKWVLEHHEEWGEDAVDEDPLKWDNRQKLIVSRFGILSGYSPQASMVFPDAEAAESKLKFHRFGLSEEERNQYYAYCLADRSKRKLPGNLRNKLDMALEKEFISEHEAKLMRDRFLPDPFSVAATGINRVFGTGFSDQDERYYNDVAKIIKKTGADKVL